MRVTKALAAAAIAASFGIGPGQAQSSDSGAVPAEFPPSSYAGRQYVDSNGCVFIRAGVDGATTWVPRVSRSRQLVCGFQPSLPSLRRTADAPAQTAPAQAAPTTAQQRQAPQRQAAPVVTMQQPAARTAAPAPRPQSAQSATANRRPAPTPTTVARPAPVRAVTQAPAAPTASAKRVVSVPAAQPAPRRTATSSCVGLTGVSARYSAGEGVRCGPQDTPHVTYIQGGGGTGAKTRRVVVIQPSSATAAPVYAPSAVQTGAAHAAPSAPRPVVVTGQTRVVPRHVHVQQQNAKGIKIPKGYKSAWTDDRLNPYRAQQTLDGMAQMDVTWSRTVPRYLIDARTGRDISFRYPGLRYPYTSFEQQRAAGVVVSTQGRVVPDPVRVKKTRAVRHTTRERQTVRRTEGTRAQDTGLRAVVSTQSQQPAAQVSAPGKRYVQAGMFSVPGNAQTAALRLSRMGLPARLAQVTRGGRSYTLVLTGPFSSEQELRNALQITRQAGFADAFLR